MNAPDSQERLERLKQLLADSYPSRAEKPEPLPESIRAALRGGSAPPVRAASVKAPLLERLLSLFRGPQLVALGAVAVVVLVAVIALNPPGTSTDGTGNGTTMRSTGSEAGLPPVVVLHGLDPALAEELETSGYFREGQLLRVDPDGDLTAFLESHRRPNLVLVDGSKGGMVELSAPFAGDDARTPVAFGPDEDLAGSILEILAGLPGPDETPPSE